MLTMSCSWALYLSQGTHGLSLFTFKLAGAGGTWVKLTSNASASFYDANEDQSTDHVNWHVEIDGGDEEMKLRCSEDELRYIFVPRERRMTFAANGKVFALYWASAEAARSFMEQLGDNIFCNRYQFDIHDEERRAALADEVAAQGGGYVPAPGAPALGPMDEDAASDYQDANEAADWAEKQQQQQDAEGSEPATPRTAKRVIGPNWLAEDAPTPAATPYHALIMGAGAAGCPQRTVHATPCLHVCTRRQGHAAHKHPVLRARHAPSAIRPDGMPRLMMGMPALQAPTPLRCAAASSTWCATPLAA